MATPDHLLAVCGPKGLIIYNGSTKFSVEIFKTGDYQSIEWSKTGKYLACIYGSNCKVSLFFISAIGKHIEVELASSVNACYLSFSPCENWLIVGMKNFKGEDPEFRLYTLASGEEDFKRPLTLTLSD